MRETHEPSRERTRSTSIKRSRRSRHARRCLRVEAEDRPAPFRDRSRYAPRLLLEWFAHISLGPQSGNGGLLRDSRPWTGLLIRALGAALCGSAKSGNASGPSEIGDDDSVLLVDDTTTLVALAQMCVLEVHTWGARMATLDRPDVLVFDLDPDGEVPWSEEELDLGVTPTQFTVQNVLLRLRTNGDPWAGKGSAILR